MYMVGSGRRGVQLIEDELPLPRWHVERTWNMHPRCSHIELSSRHLILSLLVKRAVIDHWKEFGSSSLTAVRSLSLPLS